MDTHGMKFVVDTTGVAKGFRDYRSAVDGILSSLEKFEAHVRSTMSSVEKSVGDTKKIHALKRSIKALGDTKINAQLARNLDKLSASMKGFKAPSSAAVKNTRAFFKVLQGMPDLTAAARGANAIKRLGAGMQDFKAPSKANAEKLLAFARAVEKSQRGFKALRNIRGISGIANELASISIAMRNFKPPTANQARNLNAFALALSNMRMRGGGGIANIARTMAAISGFKAPTAAQIRNLSAFVDAIGKMRVPRNARELADALVRIARAANSAAQNTRRLRGGLGGLNGGLRDTAGGARRARIEMMGLQNAFSATFQIGSALRSLFGALTIAELGRKFLTAANSAEQLRAQMTVISTETGFAQAQLEFVRKTADDLGLDLNTATKGFGRISIAAHKAGMSVQDSRHIFEGFGTAMTVLGTSTERQNDVLLALQQVMNKGYLSAEELNQQLNEHLPGAMANAGEYAKELGVTLEEGLKKKMLDAEGVLRHMSKAFKEEFGPALEEALKRPDIAFTRLNSRIDVMFQKIGDAGVNRALGDFLNSITNSMDEETLDRYAHAWGTTLTNAINKARAAFEWIRDNWSSIEGPLFTGLDILGKYIAITGAFQIGRAFITPMINAATAVRNLTPLVTNLTRAMAALNAQSMAAFLANLRGISSPTIRRGVVALTRALQALQATLLGGALIRGLRGLQNGLGSIARLARAAAGPILRLAGVITAGLGLAWAVGAQSAEQSLGRQSKVTYSFVEIAVGLFDYLGENISNMWANVTKFFADVMTQLAEYIGIEVESVGEFFVNILLQISLGITKFVEAGTRAFAGLFKSLGLWIMDAGKALHALFSGDFFGAGALAAGLFSGKQFVEGFSGAFEGFSIDFASYKSDVGKGFDAFVVDPLNALGKRGRDKLNPAQEKPDLRAVMSDEDLAAIRGDPRESLANDGSGGGGGGGGKGGKGGKGDKSTKDRAEDILNDVRSLMQSFSDIDPVGQLYRDYVDTLREQGRILLNDGTFEQWNAGFTALTREGKVSIDQLIERLESGSGLSRATFAILEREYGQNVDSIIANLRGAQVAFERETRDAMNAAVDFRTGDVIRFMEAFGEDFPEMQQFADSLDEVRNRAAAVLNDESYADFITQISDGTWRAEDALDALNERMSEQNSLSDTAIRQLEQMGLETEDLVRANKRLEAVKKRDLALTQRSLQFGADQIANLQQELALSTLSQQDRRVAEVIQEAFQQNPYASREQIEALEQQTRALFDQADAVQRLNDLYENNGVRGYINDINQAGLAAAELDRNVLQSLEDQLFSLGKTGQFSFTAIFDTIHEGLLRFASQGIVKHMLEGVFGGREGMEGGNPSLFGGFMEGLFGEPMGAEPQPLGTLNKPMYVKLVNGLPGPAGMDMRTGEFTNERGFGIDVGGIEGGETRYRLQDSMENLTNSTDKLFNSNEEHLGNLHDILGHAQSGSLGVGGGVASAPGVETAVAEATTATTQSFSDTMIGMMPMIGMAFAGSFKSPIAQVAVMFGTMILQKLLMGGMGGGGGGLLAGLFSEGGVSTNPVSRAVVPSSAFSAAPKFMTGTPFAGGGMPAVLHPNEAVIPLSRNRKVPVEMNGNQGGQVINNNFHVTTPDADSFRKSKQQLATDLHMSARRSFARNRG